MSKRYQVFISSTYADLKDERSKVIQTIMELDCIPAGMELFPAIDNEQFEFIKRVINDCDYYILIIGGRYGSLSSDGLSYTEKEFDYALERNIKVIAFIHENPDNISLGKSETSEDLRTKLDMFKEKVSTNRLVKFWNNANELPGLVALSLSKTIKTYPAIGWIRANTIGNPEIYLELNEARKHNSELKDKVDLLTVDKSKFKNLADLKDTFKITGKYKWFSYRSKDHISKDWVIEITWENLFSFFSPYLLQPPSDKAIKVLISKILYEKLGDENNSGIATINDQDFQTLKIHFSSLRLIEVKYTSTTGGGMGLFWRLTKEGTALMMELRSVKKKL